LQNTQGTSNKFWDVIVHPSDDNEDAASNKGWSYTCHYGRNGTAGSQQQQDFGSKYAANRAAQKKIDQKLSKGYEMLADFVPDKAFEIRLGPVKQAMPEFGDATNAEVGKTRRKVLKD
jgi:predicted DNA-binding WGR domain protein